MPAVEDGASWSAISQTTQNGAVAFATTHWSVVLEAQGESPAATKHLKNFAALIGVRFTVSCRRQGAGPEEAKDLTQGFFALLLERRDSGSRPQGERALAFLSTHLTQTFSNERAEPRLAIKRGEGRRLISLDELRDA